MDMARLGKALLQIGLASAVAALASWGGLSVLHMAVDAVGYTPSVKAGGVLEIAIGGGAGIVGYVALAQAMGMAELTQLRRVMKRQRPAPNG
jgi:hypothetical protein